MLFEVKVEVNITMTGKDLQSCVSQVSTDRDTVVLPATTH